MSEFVKKLEQKERLRQEQSVNLIASENYASKEVLEVLSGPFVNKYAEGSPRLRFYAGCSVVDELESYGQTLACKIFKSEYANLQPHSGACANWIAYFAVLEPGDTVVAMDLSAGGHLTHGFSKSLTAKIFKFVHYGVDPVTFKINYQEIEDLVVSSGAKMLVAGASSYPFLFHWEKLGEIAKRTGVVLLADIAHTAGLIAGGALPSPFPYADIATMTTQKSLRGPRGGMILAKQEWAGKLDKTVMPGFQGGPNMATVASKIIALELSQTEGFAAYAAQILANCKAFCRALTELGVPPVGGGSENHLLLLETEKNFGLTGKKAQDLLSQYNIDVNRNHLPGDKMISSGIRIGTPAITTRGATEKDCEKIAALVVKILRLPEPTAEQRDVLKKEVWEIIATIQGPFLGDSPE